MHLVCASQIWSFQGVNSKLICNVDFIPSYNVGGQLMCRWVHLKVCKLLHVIKRQRNFGLSH